MGGFCRRVVRVRNGGTRRLVLRTELCGSEGLVALSRAHNLMKYCERKLLLQFEASLQLLVPENKNHEQYSIHINQQLRQCSALSLYNVPNYSIVLNTMDEHCSFYIHYSSRRWRVPHPLC